MTAFAAVIEKHGRPHALAGVASALGSIYGMPAGVITLGNCAMVLAPLHADDPAGPVVLPSGIAVAGQILLEGRRGLALTLGQAPSAPASILAGLACERWGSNAAGHLAGEFAFTVWDPRRQTLFCARDGMGLRLLYVADSAETLVVTNVLAAALAHPSIAADRDDVALVEFLARGGAGDEVRTAYRDVRVLPAGHTLAIDVGRGAARMHRHWQFPVADALSPRSEPEILEQYRSVLREAVSDRIGQRGTSIFLSGGLDSTTIAAAACEIAPTGQLAAITARYPRYVADDELRYTRGAARMLGLPLTVIEADRHEPWHSLSSSLCAAEPLDEPMLTDWREAVATAAEFGTVSLYGEDGDALFRAPGWRALRRAGSLRSIASAAASYLGSERRLPYLGLRLRERLGIKRRRPPALPAWLTPEAGTVLAHAEAATVLGHAPTPLPPHPTRPETQARLTDSTYCRDFAATVAAETTRQRTELRFPLFDSRLVRVVISIPPIPWCQRKALPRRAYRGRLPAEVLDRPKTPLAGFEAALVHAWRISGARVPDPAGRPGEWVDAALWRRTLQEDAAPAVMVAWRVIALDAWLAAGSGAAPRETPCIQ